LIGRDLRVGLLGPATSGIIGKSENSALFADFAPPRRWRPGLHRFPYSLSKNTTAKAQYPIFLWDIQARYFQIETIQQSITRKPASLRG
jgi:hypothetical protein